MKDENANNFWLGNLKEIGHTREKGIGEGIILKGILEKCVMRMRIDFIWFKTELSSDKR
jgi:hypothetical protein